MAALLVDLDDTLIDERYAFRRAFEALVARQFGEREIDASLLFYRWGEISKKYWVRYEVGELSFLEQRRERLREFFDEQYSDEVADEIFQSYESIYQASFRVLPGVPEFLIATKHLKKAIVTNGNRQQQLLKLRATGIFDEFEAVITPADCGYFKPNVNIFSFAASTINVELSECIVIGDCMVRDIAPAQELGIGYFHVSDANPVNQFDSSAVMTPTKSS